MAEGHQEPLGTGLVPPSHFMLRPSRTLGAELEAERGRSQALGAELEAERRRSQALEAELEAERRRSQALEAELEAERRRGQALGAELEAERRRGQALGAELEAERGRSQALGAELEAERGRSQALGAELEAERGRSQSLGAELEAERGRSQGLGAELEALRGRVQAQGAEPGAEQPLGQVLLQAQLSALSHILTLQEQELDLEVSPPGPRAPRLGTLLGRWRQKVFVLLVQLQVQEEALRSLRGQVGALGTVVAAGTRRVTQLELQLHEGEKLRGDRQRLEREAARQRGRAQAALGALGALVRAASSLAGAVAALEAQVTKATRSLGTMSGRLSRAGRRLRDLRGLVAPEQPRWPQDPAGANAVTQVTKPAVAEAPAVTRDTVALGGRGGAVSPRPPSWRPQVAPRGSGTGPSPSREALAALVTQLQALGAAILGDTGDTGDPP